MSSSSSKSVKKMIWSIKEIAGSHTHGDEEVYAMLKECNMDPNLTAITLLNLDTFHEVRRRRYRKKENVNKDSVESRLKSSIQGQGDMGIGRNYASHYASHDGGSWNSASSKGNGTKQVPKESVGVSTQPNSNNIKNKGTSSTSTKTVITADCPASLASKNTSIIQAGHLSAGGGNKHSAPEAADISMLEGPPTVKSLFEANIASGSSIACAGAEKQGQFRQTSSNTPTSTTSAPSPGYFSASDPVVVSSQDSRLLGAVDTIRREVGSQQIPKQKNSVVPVDSQLITVPSEVGSSFVPGKVSKKSQLPYKNQFSEASRSALSSHGGGPSTSRPSSSDSSRLPQVVGPQKVGLCKEWKPKPVNSNPAQGSGRVASSDVSAVRVDAKPRLLQAEMAIDSKETISDLGKKLKQSHISDSQRVIIPDHLLVPEIEKLGFYFGSFDACFKLSTIYSGGPENDKDIHSETSEGMEESVQQLSNSNAVVTAEEDYTDDYPPSSSHVPESLTSTDDDASCSVVLEHIDPKQETDLPTSTDSQAHDISIHPSFVVHQPFDPTSYYAQFYQFNVNSDGRISPIHGISTKNNGNVSVLPLHASQSSQEAGNVIHLSTTVPTSFVTEGAGIMQSSIAVTQQPLPVFRQPTGMQLTHYPTNYIPYGHYFSPFYVPPPAIHQFLSNGVFPPQPQTGSVYPAPPVATTKHPPSQYKQGSSTGNPTHMGMPGNYGSYGSSAGFNPNSVTGKSTPNEDFSQFKENNIYVTGQQTEGSGVWIPAPGRDISSLHTSSFYNLPQAQMVVAATQAGHNSFASIYHPGQPVTVAAVHPHLQQSQTMAGAVDMAGPTASVYQPAQPVPINWPNNY